MNEIVSSNDLKPEPDAVRALVEEMAESYEKPEEVIKWFYSDTEQLANIEALALEESVIDMVVNAAKVSEANVSYEEALQASTPKPAEVDTKNGDDESEAKKSSD